MNQIGQSAFKCDNYDTEIRNIPNQVPVFLVSYELPSRLLAAIQDCQERAA